MPADRRAFQIRATQPGAVRMRRNSVRVRARVEPVERLGRDDEVDARIGQAGRLGRARQRAEARIARQRGLGRGPHRGIRFDADDLEAGGEKQGGGDAGARPDVGDDGARSEDSRGSEVVHDGLRVAGSGADVVVDPAGEAVAGVSGVGAGMDRILLRAQSGSAARRRPGGDLQTRRGEVRLGREMARKQKHPHERRYRQPQPLRRGEEGTPLTAVDIAWLRMDDATNLCTSTASSRWPARSPGSRRRSRSPSAWRRSAASGSGWRATTRTSASWSGRTTSTSICAATSSRSASPRPATTRRSRRRSRSTCRRRSTARIRSGSSTCCTGTRAGRCSSAACTMRSATASP